MPSKAREQWPLDPAVTYLNHGSFGACPRAVIAEQRLIADALEREPVRFMFDERASRLAEARCAMSDFVGADPRDVVFVNNATAGVNAVLRSLQFSAGDELLTTNHAYPACRYVLDFVAQRSGAAVVVADVPFPISDEQQVTDAVMAAVTPRTKIALIDHVTSATGLVFPIVQLAASLKARGVPLLVDGAHAPGMVELDLDSLGASYYAGNFHKWGCAPKGTAMLWVRRDLQAAIYPPVISHGYAAPSEQRFQAMFDWTGTEDPSAWLTLPFALKFMAELGGSWEQVRAKNRQLALAARRCLCEAWGVEIPAPESMIGSLAAIALPSGHVHTLALDPLQFELREQHGFQVVVSPWPRPPARVLRVSAQLYNSLGEYQRLAGVVKGLL
ncbi:MAG: hypothetical protein RJA70_4737 [Pseudomonadota bacterium]